MPLGLSPLGTFPLGLASTATPGSSQTLVIANAALQLAGGDVVLRVTRRIAVQQAQVQLGGGAALLQASRKLAMLSAALTTSPGAVGLKATRHLSIVPTSLAFTGRAIGMTYSPKPDAGSYSLAVSAAAINLVGGEVRLRISRRLAVEPTRLDLAIGDVSVLVRRRFLVWSESLALTGGGVTLRFSTESPPLDVAKVHPSRVVMFEGSGSRVVIFEGSGSKVVVFESSGKRMRFNQMSAKVPTKIGGKWTTDRDRDEVSYYAADITDELADRDTTPDVDNVTALVYGVELLEGPQVQVATVEGIERTFVVVKLGDAAGTLPDDWRWVARVPCANGERFDKTTWFNEVDP